MEEDIKPTLILKDSQHKLLSSPFREHATEKRDTIKLVDNAAKLEMTDVLTALVKSEPNIPGNDCVQTKHQELVSEQEIVPTMLSPNQEEIVRGVLQHWTRTDESQKTTHIFQKVVSEVIDTQKQPRFHTSTGNNEINVSLGEFSEELGQDRKTGSLELENQQRSTAENAILKYNNSGLYSDVVDDLISFDETSTVTVPHYKQIADPFGDTQDGHSFIPVCSLKHWGKDSLNTIDTSVDSDALRPVSITQLSSIEPRIHDHDGYTAATEQFSVEARQVNVESSHLLMDMTESSPSIQQLQRNEAQQAGNVSSIVSSQSQPSNVLSTSETFERGSRHVDVRDIEQVTVSQKPIENSAASRTLTTTDHSPHETSLSTKPPTTTDHSSPRAAGRQAENEVVMRPKAARTSHVRETATRQPDSSLSKNKRPESMVEVPRSSTSSNRLTDMRKSFTIDKSLPPLRQLSALRPLSASMSDLSRFDGKQTGRPVSGSFTTSSFSSSVPRIDYTKTRDNDGLPFQVDVLQGIVGIGLKVKVVAKGQVQITEIQRGGPVEKNGHVRVGDFLLFVNSTELTGQTDARVQQVLRLLPRGLTKLVISSSAPAPSSTGSSRLSLYDKNSTNAQHLQQSPTESLRSSRSFGSHTNIAVNGRESVTFGLNNKSPDQRIHSLRLSTEATTGDTLEAKATHVQEAAQDSLSRSFPLQSQAAQDSLSQSLPLQSQAAQNSLSQSFPPQSQAAQDSLSQIFPPQSQAAQDILSQSFSLQSQASQDSLSQSLHPQSQAAQGNLSQSSHLESQTAQESLPQSFSHLESQAVDVVVRPKPAPRLHNANKDNHEKTLIENTRLKTLQDSKSTEEQITVVKHPPDQEVGTRLTHHQDSERSKDEVVPRAAVRVTSAAVTKPRPKSSSSIEFDTKVEQVTFPTASIRSTTRSNPSIYDLNKKEVESVYTRINEKVDSNIKKSKEVDTIFSGLSETIDSTPKTPKEVNRMYPRTINISEPTSRKEFNANMVSTRTTSSVSTPGNPTHPSIGSPRQLDEPGNTKPQRKISLGYERFQSIIGATKSSAIIEKSGTFVSSKARLFDQKVPVSEEAPSEKATRTRRKSESVMVNLERSRNINPPLSSTVRLYDEIEPVSEEAPSEQATRIRRKSESLMVNLERSRNINPPLKSIQERWKSTENVSLSHDSKQSGPSYSRSKSTISYAPPVKVTSSSTLERSRKYSETVFSSPHMNSALSPRKASFDTPTITTPMVKTNKFYSAYQPSAGKLLSERKDIFEKAELSQTAQLNPNKPEYPGTFKSTSSISVLRGKSPEHSSSSYRDKIAQSVISRDKSGRPYISSLQLTTPFHNSEENEEVFGNNVNKLDMSLDDSPYQRTTINQSDSLNDSPYQRTNIKTPDSLNDSPYQRTNIKTPDSLNDSPYQRTNIIQPDSLNNSPYQRTSISPPDSLNDSPYQRTSISPPDSLNDSRYQRTDTDPHDLSLSFPKAQSSLSTSPSKPPMGNAPTSNLIELEPVNKTNQLHEFRMPVTIQPEKPNDSSLHTIQSQEMKKDKALLDTLKETCETEEMKGKDTVSRTQDISLNTLTGMSHSADSWRLGETLPGDKELRNVSTNSLHCSENDSELHHNTAHTQDYNDKNIVTRKDKNNDDIGQEETRPHNSVEVDSFVSTSENDPPALPSAPPPPLLHSDTNLLANVHDLENLTPSPLPPEIKPRSVDGRLESNSSDPPSAFRSVQMRVNIHTGAFFVANQPTVTKGDLASSNDYTDSVYVNVDTFNERNNVQAGYPSPVDMFNESNTVQAISSSPVDMFDERDNRQAISPSPIDMLSEDSGMPADEDQEVATDDAISPPGELAENAFGTDSIKNALSHSVIEREILSIESRNKQSSALTTKQKRSNVPDNERSIIDEVFRQKDERIKAINEDISENEDLTPPLLPSSLPPSISSVNSSVISQVDSLSRAIPPNVKPFLGEANTPLSKPNSPKPVSRVDDLIVRSEITLTSATNPETGNEREISSQSTRNPNTDVQSISSESRWEIMHTDSDAENYISPHLERTDVSTSSTAPDRPTWLRVEDTSIRKAQSVAQTAGWNFEIKNQDSVQHLPVCQAASETQVSKTQPETRLSETPSYAGDSITPSQTEVSRTSSQTEVSRTSSQTEVSKITSGFPSEERDTSETKHNTTPASVDLVHVSERAFNDRQLSHIIDGQSTVITSTRKWCLRSNVCQSPVLTAGSEVPEVPRYTERVLVKALPYTALASMIDKANAVLDSTSPSARLWLVILHLHGNGSPLGVDLKHEGGACFRVSGIKKGGVVALDGGAAVGDRLVAVDSLWCDHVTVMRFLSRLAKPKHDSILVLAKEENAGDTTVQQATTSLSKQDGQVASRKHEPKSSEQDHSFFTDATDAALSSTSRSVENVHPSEGTPPLPKLPPPHQELQPTEKTPQFTKQEPQLLEQMQSPRRQLPMRKETPLPLDNPPHVSQEVTPLSLKQSSTLGQERHLKTLETDTDGTVQTSSDKAQIQQQSVELSHTFSKEQVGSEIERASVQNSRKVANATGNSSEVSVARQSKTLTELQEQSAAEGTSSAGSQAELGSGVHKLVMSIGATGVGFCLEGGVGSPKGDLPITIKRIFKGGSAEKCGLLKVKDEIHEVNGLNFSQMGHFEAWKHLKFLKNEDVHMTIQRN